MKITEVFITEYFYYESENNKTFFFVLLVDDEADSDMRFTEGELLAGGFIKGECEPCAQ